ncbi:hypothetical protein [Campylobacter sp. 19-13652]|nr:hypothetical protein [Campylobacter sp. 19-13652]BCX79259.1 hypothetical protein LBC_07210 [Campylobacter sp. 19-13652]
MKKSTNQIKKEAKMSSPEKEKMQELIKEIDEFIKSSEEKQK